MYTKSLIKQIIEDNDRLNYIKEELNDLMNKYLIEDSIFIYNNNKINQVTKGYFVVSEEYNDFNEAMKNYNPLVNAIRITENKEFLVGTVYNKISDCPAESERLYINNI